MCMTVISNLEYDRNCYFELRDKIKNICTDMNTNINNLSQTKQNIDKYLKIDDVNNPHQSLSNKIEELKEIYNNLINNVIPAINSKIDSINNNIKDIQVKESYE